MARAHLTHHDHRQRWNNDKARVWRGWTHSIPLADAIQKAGERGGPPFEAGAYVLSAQSALGGSEPIRLNRMLGTDEWAVLDIGESANLAGRIKQLARCTSNASARGHMAGWRYAYLRLAEKLPPHDLLVSWRADRECYRLEAETMAAYVNAFGELPPLNYKANWALLA